jgi:surfeit locus 1 family protein
VAAVVVAAACIRLGIWQLDRLAQRRERSAALAARLALPPIEIRSGTLAPDSVRQRRVTLRGAYDYEREFVWPARVFEGTPGVSLITPLRLPDGTSVFVDRGWVPSADAFHVDRTRYREGDSAVVEGVALIPPRGRGDVHAPFVAQQEQPLAAHGLPRRWPRPALDNGPHLSYAIQWFSFALIALVGTAVLLRRSRAAE